MLFDCWKYLTSFFYIYFIFYLAIQMENIYETEYFDVLQIAVTHQHPLRDF